MINFKDELDELDDILTLYNFEAAGDYGAAEYGARQETKQQIIDWHNKQIEAELEALREELKHEDLRTISQVITARIDTLKTNKYNTVEKKL